MGSPPDRLRFKRKTCRRENDPGNAHSLTFSCFKGRSFLSRDRTRQWFVEALSTARVGHHFDLWAYVLMPEHVHLLIFPRDDSYSISDILRDLKQPVTCKAVAYIRTHAPSFLPMMRDQQPSGRTTYRFWQRGGGYDRNLIEPRTIHSTIAYIHANPVRRGLVLSPDDWAWSSAQYFASQGDVPLVPDVGSIPPIDK